MSYPVLPRVLACDIGVVLILYLNDIVLIIVMKFLIHDNHL